MLHLFHMDAAKIDRGMLHMLQANISSVLYVSEVCFICVFPDACCKCVYLDVAYVSHIRCMCFIWMLLMVAVVFRCFFMCFQKHVSSVSDVCYNCFI